MKTRTDYILKQCTDKNVLHIGATDWPFCEEKFVNDTLLYSKINMLCNKQIGIDMDKEGIEYLNHSYCNMKRSRMIYGDMNKLNKLNIDLPHIDVIVFGETIEHIMNMETCLRSLQSKMSKDTVLICTTPNSLTLSKVFDALFDKEMQHPDHNVVFTRTTLKQLFIKCEFEVLDQKMCFLEREKYGILTKINKVFAKVFPRFSEGLIIVVKKRGEV